MFDQSPYTCRVEWGQRGAREAAARGDITIIVDILSFSTAVVSAVHHGALILPFPPPINEKAEVYAKQMDAELLIGRAEAAKLGRPSLSPVSFGPKHKGKKFVMCSLNGAVCTWTAANVPALLVGSFLNALSVAETTNRLIELTGKSVTIVPCGEKWKHEQEGENLLRPSIEDYLGAGAILTSLTGTKSPEAIVCMGAFYHVKDRLSEILWDCGSGRELRERGFGEDVAHASRLNAYPSVPMLKNNAFHNVSTSTYA